MCCTTCRWYRNPVGNRATTFNAVVQRSLGVRPISAGRRHPVAVRRGRHAPLGARSDIGRSRRRRGSAGPGRRSDAGPRGGGRGEVAQGAADPGRAAVEGRPAVGLWIRAGRGGRGFRDDAVRG